MRLAAPQPLIEAHRIDAFSCGVASLDGWLRKRALVNQASGASRTFVATEIDKVIAYYALAAGSVEVAAAPGRFRRNMPDPIPIVVLGRLAVDLEHHGRGVGRGLVRDCAIRVAQAADAIGIRGILVHAISDEAKAFYISVGFEPSPTDPLMLMITLADIRKILG